MILSPLQDQAVRSIVDWYRSGSGEFYLAGYAGSGKTTLLRYILDELRAHHDLSSYAVGAYTGKAAHVLRKKGMTNAATLHSQMYMPVPDSHPVEFVLAFESFLRYADLVVVDEVSMVGPELADDLRTLARKILVIGDPGQLPPINGAGAFTSRDPDFFLHEIHRQALDHPILRLATMAREGRPITPADSRPGAEVVYARSWDDLDAANTQIICGRHRTRFAVTRHLREASGYGDYLPRPGEPLICRQNDRERGLYNGQGATVRWVDTERGRRNGQLLVGLTTEDGDDHELIVADRDFREHYEGRNLAPPQRERGVARMDFSYCLTCHASQGSEWDAVTVIDDSDAFREDRHRWLYTAITRASGSLKLLLRR